MGSEGSGGARVGDGAKGGDGGRSSVFAGVKIERSGPRGVFLDLYDVLLV